MQKAKVSLNKNQKKAVNHKYGPLLVVAGAGTGKTRVITERIRHLIKKEKIDPKEILAVTFTEKASKEMLNRLDDIMPLGYEEPWVYTFHSFADRVLRNEGLEIGIDSSYKIMSYSEQWLLFRQHLFELKLNYFRPLGNPTKFITAILRFISRLQDESISPQDFKKYVKNFKGDKEEKERWAELAYIYEKYSEIKLSESKMDFGDLIAWTTKLFEQRQNILKKYQNQFKHVLVDEFQDTNFAQYELIKMLCPSNKLKKRSLLVVGDDSQSIYKFRGAAVSNILEFRKDYKESEMITLLENFRSTQSILDSAYKLIKNNNPDTLESKLGISKKLKSVPNIKGEKPKAAMLKTVEDEVEYTVLEILKVLGQEPDYTYKDIAILARANNHLEPFVFALRKYGIPYQLVGNRGLYDREEIRDVIALLRVVVNPRDSLSLYRTLNVDTFEVNPNIISKILSTAKYKKLDMWDLVKDHNDRAVTSLYEKIQKYQKIITERAPSEFVYEFVIYTGYLKQYLKEDTVENQLSVKNLNLFLDKVKQFEVDYRSDTNEIPTVVDLLDHIDLMIDAGENPAQAEIEDIDTVNLLTVHASKGLEFPVVFMANLVGGRFPTRNRKDPIQIPDDLIKETLPLGNVHLQEERRLFYVGMTRAKKYLYMLMAKNYGGKREKVPSGYISETGIKIEEIDKIKKDATQESLFGVGSDFREAKASKLEDTHVLRQLSYSKVSSYKTCPLKYKYRYILNIPTPPSHALSFGITIHDTLRDFHSAQLLKAVSLNELYDMYEKNWRPLGYLNKKHREERYESGKKLLKEYYEQNKYMKTKPLELEKSFNVKIGGVRFFGRIDRIDPLPNGGVEIIDYKTGNLRTQKDVDKDDQVSFYAIAAKEALGLDPKKMTLHFLEGNKKLSTTRTKKELEKKKEEVKGVISKIKIGNFKATPGMHCKWCDFKEVCPYAYKG